MEVLVKVTAHRGIIIIDAVVEGAHPYWFPVGGSRIGCVLHDTKQHLGVSEEALALLETVPKSQDSIGDVDWFDTDDGKRAFCWLGSEKRFVDPTAAEGSRQYKVTRDCIIIPNESDPVAIGVIDDRLGHQEVPSG
jgi:hypothetical protein